MWIHWRRHSSWEKSQCGRKRHEHSYQEAIQMLSEESQEETSLLEIKNILIDISIQLSTILKDNIELQNEFEELKCSVNPNRKELNSLTESVNFNGKEIENLKGSLKKATDTNKELKNTISLMNNRLKTVNQDLENQHEETKHLSEELDNLEQYSRKNSVESMEYHKMPTQTRNKLLLS